MSRGMEGTRSWLVRMTSSESRTSLKALSWSHTARYSQLPVRCQLHDLPLHFETLPAHPQTPPRYFNIIYPILHTLPHPLIPRIPIPLVQHSLPTTFLKLLDLG